jgi:hypothetical protein
MATAASQPYIARLGFQDPDRRSDRHGLACEYLLERLIELEIAARVPRGPQDCLFWDSQAGTSTTVRYDVPDQDSQQALAQCLSIVQRDPRINVPIKDSRFVVGFADVLMPSWQFEVRGSRSLHRPSPFWDSERSVMVRPEPVETINHSINAFDGTLVLGEVKIKVEPAEIVLQQINYYRSHLAAPVTYVLTDYDPAPLKRLTEGTNIKVFRLGDRFEQWIAQRELPSVEEL